MYIGKCPDSFGYENRLEDDPIYIPDDNKSVSELLAEAKEAMLKQVFEDAERTRDLFLKVKLEYLAEKNKKNS